MTQSDSDNQAHDDTLSQLYQLGASETTSADLDSNVLALAYAQADVNANRRYAPEVIENPAPANRPWYHLGGVAAVVLLSSSLIINLYMDAPDALLIQQDAPPAAYQTQPETADETRSSESFEWRILTSEPPRQPAAEQATPQSEHLQQRKALQHEEPSQKEKSQAPQPSVLKPVESKALAPESRALLMPQEAPSAQLTSPAAVMDSPMMMDSVTEDATATVPQAESVREEANSRFKAHARFQEKIRMTEKDWLAEIDGLIAQGRREEAKASLEAFREAYPEYVLEERYLNLE